MSQNERDSSAGAPKPQRLLSLDTYRGLIMCSLAINGFALARTAKKIGYGPNVEVDSWIGWVWQTLAFQNTHPFWNSQFYLVGCSYWDLIQPSFMFMVGVAMPYSYASRRAIGHSSRKLVTHAAVRALVLVLLGVFLQTQRKWFDTPNLFTNVLAQIGLGYFFVYLLLARSVRVQIAVFVLILAGYTGALLAHPVASDPPAKAVDSMEELHVPASISTQYAILTNGAADLDERFLNALVRPEKPIPKHPAGYTTFNFIPSIATMLLGVLAGTLLRSDRSESGKVRILIQSGVACMCAALLASYTVCPIIKKIWTPSWVLFSGAYVLWILAALYWLIDIKQYRLWTKPLVVVGANSLAIYLMSMLMKPWITGLLTHYFGDDIFAGSYGPTIQAIGVFAVLWLICLYLYQNKLFLRV